MIELKLRSIMKQVKSDNPEKRFEALDHLFQYKMDDGLEVQVDVLKDIIKLAAGSFPNPVDTWDNPSYYLVDFVCDFPMKEVEEGIIKNFDGFHLHAKERAIEFLLSTESERVFHLLAEKIIHLIQTEEVSLPIGELSNYPLLIKLILDECLDKIRTPYYKYVIYDLLLALNASGLERSYKKEIVVPLLMEDYSQTEMEYMQFDKEYKVDFVYKAWKQSYFVIRNRMRLFISLMEFYFSIDTENKVISALSYRDPLILTEALLVCIEKNITVDNKIIIKSAENLESAEMLYWELTEKNKEHLYPIKENKQQHLAKARLFSYIINLPEDDDGHIRFPEEIKVIERVETENSYGQPIRYYMMSFKELDHTFIGWVGGYALEDGEDTAQLWDGTYSEFVEFESLTKEQHKETFFAKREEDFREYESYTHYESSPKLHNGMWFLYAIMISQWIRAFTSGNQDAFTLPIILSLLAFLLTGIEMIKNKASKVSIIGKQLIFQKGKETKRMDLQDIKKIEYNRKRIFVYNKRNELVISIPLKWVRYEQFRYFMNEQTNHLKDRPYIQE